MLIALIDPILSQLAGIANALEWFGVDPERVRRAREAVRTGLGEGVVAGIRAGITAGVNQFLELNVENEELRGRLSRAFRQTSTRALQYRGGESISVNRDDILRRIFSEIQAESTERRGTMPSPPEGVLTTSPIRW